MKTRVELLERIVELEQRDEQNMAAIEALTTSAQDAARKLGELEEDRSELLEVVEDIKHQRDGALRQRDEAIDQRNVMSKQRDEVIAENAQLRDRLHELTVENARLAGYRDRVREFDPVTERQAYDDDRRERDRPRPHIEGAQARDMFGGAGRVAAPRWYHRRG